MDKQTRWNVLHVVNYSVFQISLRLQIVVSLPENSYTLFSKYEANQNHHTAAEEGKAIPVTGHVGP
jgi:hypothetical protein